LDCDDTGAGPGVIVLLHGFPLGRAMWSDVARGLARGFRVIVPDLRGHGSSPAPHGVYTMEALADDVAELLDERGVTTPVVLAGLSMGGYVALALAARHRARLRGLALCDTRAGADTPEAAKGREELAAKVETMNSVEPVIESFLPKLLAPATYERKPDLVESARALMSGQPPVGVAGCLRGMAVRPDRMALLPTLDLPTLVLVGSDDRLTPPDEARRMSDTLPDGRLTVVPGAGHLTPIEARRRRSAPCESLRLCCSTGCDASLQGPGSCARLMT
jgi:pimeloyl-ACP methyl ester carboxylesterase